MSKKMIAATVLIAVLTTAVPAYAQTVTPTPNPGFFGSIENFFGNFFHRQKEIGGQNTQGLPMESVTPGQNAPSEAMQPNPSGTPDYFSMQESRVTRLVQQGRITQSQGDAIIAELQKVDSELKSWAASEGINESYVIGGPGAGMGEGQMQGQGGQQGDFQNNTNQQGSNQQFKNHGMGPGHGDFEPNQGSPNRVGE